MDFIALVLLQVWYVHNVFGWSLMKYQTLKCRRMLTIFLVFKHGSTCLGLQALVKLQCCRIMLQPKNSSLTLIVQKSCKTSYESTQTGNESTQTVVFSGLSRPGSWPVRTRDEMIGRKIGNESTQGTGELTQSGIPRIESTDGSTCSDPREYSSKKEGAWVDAKSGWVDSLKFPRIESTGGSTCSDPGVLRRVMSQLIGLKTSKNEFFPM